MDAPLLTSRLTKARDSVCKVGERMQFTVRRPTQMEDSERRRRVHGDEMLLAFESIKACVIGWDGVLEKDIERNGANDPVKFDPELWRSWVADRPDLWLPIWEHVMKELAEYAVASEQQRGN
jgi:hypothetical protein